MVELVYEQLLASFNDSPLSHPCNLKYITFVTQFLGLIINQLRSEYGSRNTPFQYHILFRQAKFRNSAVKVMTIAS